LNKRMVFWLGGACLALSSAAAWADSRDFYVGVGAGYSTLQSSSAPFIPSSVEQHPTGWKVFAGWRPIGILGAEVEYADLGSKSGTSSSSTQHASGNAVAAYAVGYLPIPLPILDIYGKLGVGSVHTSLSYTPTQVLNPVSASGSSTVLAYAAGIQLKFGAPAVRLEYQGFNTSGGDQSMFSLDFAWNF
jgi:Outer membrane protein beta-barrel domain